MEVAVCVCEVSVCTVCVRVVYVVRACGVLGGGECGWQGMGAVTHSCLSFPPLSCLSSCLWRTASKREEVREQVKVKREAVREAPPQERLKEQAEKQEDRATVHFCLSLRPAPGPGHLSSGSGLVCLAGV